MKRCVTNYQPGIYYLIGRFIVILSACSLLTWYLEHYLWSLHLHALHNAIEFCCFLVACFCFLIVWQTNGNNRQLPLYIAYAFLVIGIFDFLHLYYYPNLKLFPIGDLDLYSRMLVVSYLIQVVTVYCVLKNPQLHINKKHRWLYLVLVIFSSVLLALFIYHDPLQLTSIPYNDVIAAAYANYQLVLALVLLYCLIVFVRQTRRINQQNIRFLLIILLAISMNLFLSFSVTSWDFANTMGHLLKLSVYLVVLLSIISRAYIDPYNYLSEVFDRLPVGLAIYDEHHRRVRLKNQLLLSWQQQATDNTPVNQIFQPPLPDAQLKFIKVARPDGQIGLYQKYQTVLPDNSVMDLYQDISHEQELTSLRLQTQTLLNSIPIPVMLLDENQRILVANPALKDLLALDFTPGADFNQLVQGLTYLVTGHHSSRDNEGEAPVHTYEISLLDNNKIINLLLNYSVVRGLQKTVIGYVIVAQDITPMKVQHEAVKQREKLAVLGQMAAGIVHEIKNPLTSIRGFAQMLITQGLVNETGRSYAELIIESSDEVNRVVSDFLAFASPRPPKLANFSLNQLISSIAYLLESNSILKNIPVHFDLAPYDLPVHADLQQIRQVIINIVKNAFEALEKTEQPALVISSRLSPDRQEMLLTITDNGPGIDLETQRYLGTPFYTTKDFGTGLGLSICYQIIKEHNGRLEVHSSPGQGTSFTIALPVAAESAA